MKELFKTENCERANDLIAYLYGEANEFEARKFERHMQECARCKAEFAEFSQIRQSIVAWRDESLSAAWLSGAVAVASSEPRAQKKSALAALREIFDLSPLWMKGAAAFASLLFCLCAVLAVAYVKESRTNIAQIPNEKVYTEQQFKEAVAKQVESIAAQRQQQNETTIANGTAPVNTTTSKRSGTAPKFVKHEYASNSSKNLRRPLTRKERDELAADLGLLASRDEDDLDLGGDRTNRTP
jgi:hypothetical protein